MFIKLVRLGRDAELKQSGNCNGQAKQDSYLGSLSKKITFKL